MSPSVRSGTQRGGIPSPKHSFSLSCPVRLTPDAPELGHIPSEANRLVVFTFVLNYRTAAAW